jgi:gamma-glutamylcyclotransferase (GGCT)/AIG2-like uncharacterized protein YtfP
MDDRSREWVFVYGTLRAGASNHFRMDGGESLGPASVHGRLYAIDWYPGLVLDAAAGPVSGEVFAVAAAHLRELDAFEGIPEGAEAGVEYRRVRARVELHSGGSRTVWLWEWLGPVEESRRIGGGDWLAAAAQ